MLAVAEKLSAPAAPDWISGRVAILLSHYFVSAVDDAAMRAIAADWIAALREYPSWAISNAVTWWIGRENDRRGRKPLPGDIADRCHRELQGVRAARIMAQLGPAERKTESRVAAGDVEGRRQAAERIMQDVMGGVRS